MTEKYSHWLPIEQMQEDHSYEAGKFVECYMVFHGVAGKCFTCCAQDYCKNLNEDSKISDSIHILSEVNGEESKQEKSQKLHS